MALELLEIWVEENRQQKKYEKLFTANFNPKQLSLQQSANWSPVPAKRRDVPTSQFTHGDGATLTLELFFDGYEDRKSVKDKIAPLYSLIAVAEKAKSPPLCVVFWGRFGGGQGKVFQGYLQSLQETYTMFLPDGTPVRATVNCSFHEWRDKKEETQAKQAKSAAKTWTVQKGDSLTSIAADQYGDASQWRLIGNANKIDNPMKLEPGQVLKVPPKPSDSSRQAGGPVAQPDDIRELSPDFQVLIGGNALPQEAAADLLEATVEEDIDVPGMFSFRLSNWDQVTQKTTWSDADLFAPGGETKIRMGYADQLQTLISGDITGIEPEFSSSEPPTVTVRGYDRRHRMMRGLKTRSFNQVKDSEIARQLASDAGLSAKVPDTGTTHEYVLQHNQSDLEFLVGRGRRIGFEVLVDDKTLIFRPRLADGTAAITLSFEEDLLEFHPRLSTMGQLTDVQVLSWDVKNGEAISVKTSAGSNDSGASGPAIVKKAFGAAAASVVDRPVRSQGEADAMAKGRFQELALGYITGEGVCIGRTDLRAGVVVQLENFGTRFSGPYYVTSTAHSWTQSSGYRTGFTVRRNAS